MQQMPTCERGKPCLACWSDTTRALANPTRPWASSRGPPCDQAYNRTPHPVQPSAPKRGKGPGGRLPFRSSRSSCAFSSALASRWNRSSYTPAHVLGTRVAGRQLGSTAPQHEECSTLQAGSTRSKQFVPHTAGSLRRLAPPVARTVEGARAVAKSRVAGGCEVLEQVLLVLIEVDMGDSKRGRESGLGTAE